MQDKGLRRDAHDGCEFCDDLVIGGRAQVTRTGRSNLSKEVAAMDFETLWYEAFPYLYGVGGVVAILLPNGSLLAKISGVLLIVASLTILRLRWVYRRDEFTRMPSASDHRPTHRDD